MEHGKRCTFFLWCIITMMVNGRRAFHVPHGEGIGNQQKPSKSVLRGTSLHVIDVCKSYSEAQISGQELRYGPITIIRGFTSDGELLAEGRQLYDIIIPKEEEIIGAELHFFISESIFKLPDETVSVKLFVIQEEFAEIIEERTIGANDFGWQVFNVKSTIQKWRNSPNLNQGFEVKIFDSSEKDISNELFIDNWKYEPVLIVFNRDLSMSESISQSVDSQISDEVESLQESENTHTPVTIARKIRSVTNDHKERLMTNNTDGNNNMCRRHEARLSFAELGWHFIIYPESFDASYCSGEICNPYLTEHLTLHEMALCKAYEAGKISKENAPNCAAAPSCRPTEYEPLTVVYEVKGSLVSTVLNNLVAAECGCQKL